MKGGEAMEYYDQELKMFGEQPKQPDMAKLRFLRWLGENGKLEHRIVGFSCGEYADSEPAEANEETVI